MRKRSIRILTAAAAIACMLICIHVFAADDVQADGAVTDTLTIKMGYWGMAQDTFVKKASYKWTDLDDEFGGALKTHKVAYSFYRENEDGEYNTVIDSARGFYLSELLDHAGIDTSNLNSIAFYTRDQSVGYFTSFTYNELFSTGRYYFNDLASHLTAKYDKSGKFIGVKIDNAAWSDKTKVEPMLALEDSWASYEIGQEHTAPNYTSMNTGNRFRLLFGQASPTESRTNQTAKYVHTLYLTFKGVPKVVKKPDKPSGKIGRHKIKIQINAQDPGMIGSLIDSMKWTSSDDSVMSVEGATMSKSDVYDDVVDVQITYNVKKKGKAGIKGKYAGIEVGGESVEVDSTSSSGGSGNKGGSGKNDNNNKGDSGKNGKSGSSGSSGSSGNGKSVKTAAAGTDGKVSSDSSGAKQMYVLDKKTAGMLSEGAAASKNDNKNKLEVSDNDRDVLPFIAAISILLGIGGMCAERIRFKKKL